MSDQDEAKAPEEPAAAPAADPEPREPARAAPPPAAPVEDVPGAGADTSRWPLAVAVLVPLALFFLVPPLSRSGLWDPHELNVADLARRVALNLHGAADLALDGADNRLPGLDDLGRPQLPFTSIALGFKLFGLREWAGRLPLAIWGLLGVVCTYGWVSRLVDKRAGVFSAIALSTMPLYFVQARTMLGDICMMSALSMSFGGLAVLVFDRDDRGDRPLRPLWLLVAVVGLLAGWGTRGGLLGIGVPCLGIGLAWLVAVAGGGRTASGSRLRLDLGALVAVLSLLGGAFALFMSLRGLSEDLTAVKPDAARAGKLNLWVGALLKNPGKYPTFDYFIGHIGHALAPWSGFIPFAMGRLFVAPVGPKGHAFERESESRMAILVGAGVCFLAHGLLAARTELIAFSGPAILAASAGIALRDYERGAHPSVAVGVGTGVFLGVFHHDFHGLPDKAYQAFAVLGATFPESFKEKSYILWTVVLVGFAGIAFLTWVERDSERKPFDPERYSGVVRSLRDAWDGLLSLAYFAMVAGASLAGLAIWVGTRTHAKWLPNLSSQIRDGVLNAWWVTAFLPIAAILGIYFWCDVWLWAFGKREPGAGAARVRWTRGFEPFEDLFRRAKETKGDTRWVSYLVLFPLMYLQVPVLVFAGLYKAGVKPLVAGALAVPSGIFAFLLLAVVADLVRQSRAAFLAAFATVTGAILCFAYYPALANQLSPKEVFESYQRVKSGNEPLGLFGVGGRTAAYYAGGQPPSFRDAQAAYDWLASPGEGNRRFLAISSGELARLNHIYRQKNRANLPVIDARSSQIYLVASKYRPDEPDQNPISKIIVPTAPKPQRKLDVNLDDKLQVLGIDILESGSRKPVDSVRAGKKYRMVTYYKVLAPITNEWEGFIHIDGYHRRHNGDHKPMDGKYPFAYWLEGDIMVDDHEFSLEPNFTPGSYTIYFGLFVGDTRFKVKSGPSDGDNRIVGGVLTVQ